MHGGTIEANTVTCLCTVCSPGPAGTVCIGALERHSNSARQR